MPKKTKNVQYYEAVGRRKQSVALVRLYLPTKEKVVEVKETKIKAGEIFVNKKRIETSFSAPYEREYYLSPLKLTNNLERFAISILVSGGGKKGQLEAITLGIARALKLVDETTYKPLLKSEQLLTRDPRKRERRKVGTGGKSRRAKQSPKR